MFDEGTVLVDEPRDQQQTPVAPAGIPHPPPAAPAAPPAPYAHPSPAGVHQTGRPRSTGVTMLLYVVTVGIYGLIWFYRSHADLRRHDVAALGGGYALLLAFVPCALFFVTPHEVGQAYVRAGRRAPVSAVTGLWLLLPVVGGIVWFVQTNRALNAYWSTVGAVG